MAVLDHGKGDTNFGGQLIFSDTQAEFLRQKIRGDLTVKLNGVENLEPIKYLRRGWWITGLLRSQTRRWS